MHTLRCAAPPPLLRPFVRAFAERQVGAIESVIQEAAPPRLEQTLEFQLGADLETLAADGIRRVAPRATAIGAYVAGGFSILLQKHVLSFGIFFQPSGLSRLFRFPMAELSNSVIPSENIIGAAALGALYDRLSICVDFRERVVAAEAFLLNRARIVEDDRRDVPDYVAHAIFSRHGGVRIASLAQQAGVGARQLERLFLRHTSFTPKIFARVARFQGALDAKLAFPRLRWLDIAHDLGYYDQMHMVRDFHDVALAAPQKILRSIGDARPPAMGEFTEF